MSSLLSMRGMFRVSDATMREQIEVVSEALATIRFVPTRVEFLWDEKMFEMVGVSPLFDSVEDGAKAPEYRFDITQPSLENGFRYDVKVVKRG